MTELDRQIGRNLQRLRADRISQAELARKMRDLGWKWTQPTVAAVESGDRPLKVAEAVHLADVLGRTYSDLISSNDVLTEAVERGRLAAVADANLRSAMAEYEESRLTLAIALDAVPADRFNNHLQAVGESWVDRPLGAVLAAFKLEQSAELEKDRMLMKETPEESSAALESWLQSSDDSWLRRLYEVDNGEHSAKA